MNEFETNWTKDEFIAYLLLYAAKADYVETEEEKEIILSRVCKEKYDEIHKEIDQDNDYVSVQKIYFNIQKFHPSKKEVNEIISEIKALFWSDGSFDRLEQNLLLGLQRLLRS